MICPYCQSNIKKNAEKTVCPDCGIPHHKECWEENGGCTSYGCSSSPVKEDGESIEQYADVGNLTVDEIKQQIMREEELIIPTVLCPNCKNRIEEQSAFCSFCGHKLREFDTEEKQTGFEEEFRRRYREKAAFNKRRKLYIALSIFIILTLITATAVITFDTLGRYYSSDEYSIRRFLKHWEGVWEKKDIAAYSGLLADGYQYIEKNKKPVDFDERIKRMAYTFENYRYIRLQIKDLSIKPDTSSWNYYDVSFSQSYVSDKVEESGVKTLRLYRGEDTGFRWKILREYFE